MYFPCFPYIISVIIIIISYEMHELRNGYCHKQISFQMKTASSVLVVFQKRVVSSSLLYTPYNMTYFTYVAKVHWTNICDWISRQSLTYTQKAWKRGLYVGISRKRKLICQFDITGSVIRSMVLAYIIFQLFV